jgi:hypothetical protein
VKHKNIYHIYEIDENLIDFLYKFDNQIYYHSYDEKSKHSEKYIGIIIEFNKQLYFAPLSSDKERK